MIQDRVSSHKIRHNISLAGIEKDLNKKLLFIRSSISNVSSLETSNTIYIGLLCYSASCIDFFFHQVARLIAKQSFFYEKEFLKFNEQNSSISFADFTDVYVNYCSEDKESALDFALMIITRTICRATFQGKNIYSKFLKTIDVPNAEIDLFKEKELQPGLSIEEGLDMMYQMRNLSAHSAAIDQISNTALEITESQLEEYVSNVEKIVMISSELLRKYYRDDGRSFKSIILAEINKKQIQTVTDLMNATKLSEEEIVPSLEVIAKKNTFEKTTAQEESKEIMEAVRTILSSVQYSFVVDNPNNIDGNIEGHIIRYGKTEKGIILSNNLTQNLSYQPGDKIIAILEKRREDNILQFKP